MEVDRFIRKQAQIILGPLLALSLSGYFVYHLVEGERGVFAWIKLTNQLKQTEAQAAQVREDREQTEREVGRLQSQHIAPDLLDERARIGLNLVAPGEVVILKDDDSK